MHYKGFALWVKGNSYHTIAKQLGTTEMTVKRWSLQEGWRQLAAHVLPQIKSEMVEQAARDIAAVKIEQAADAREMRLKIMSVLDGYRTKILVSAEGEQTEVWQDPSPGDLRMLASALREVSDLELERLGEQAPRDGRYDGRDLPFIGAMLEKIWSRKVAGELPPGQRSQSPVIHDLAGTPRPTPLVDIDDDESPGN